MTPSILGLDWETRSELDLRKVGLHRYARHPSTDIWCGAYAFDDEDPDVWVPGTPCPTRIAQHVESGGSVYAWNAPFEIELWNNIAALRYGWPVLKPENAFCSMAMSYAQGMPGGLEDAALALGLPVHKDMQGRALMLKMADRTRYKDAKPEDLARLCAYSQQDVRVENLARTRLMPLSDRERQVWLLDYKINQRGVLIDIPSVQAAVKLAEKVKNEAGEKLSKLTGGAVQAASAIPALKGWLKTQGVEVDSLAKQDVVDLLATDSLSAPCRYALTIRQEVGKASTAKFDVMLARAGDDGRLRQMYQYHGAGNGRWAGRGVQTHNLPRDMPKPDVVERILEAIREGDADYIDMAFGPPLTMASRCMRSFFMASPGKMLVGGDYANVEARGVAWLSGEEWKLRAFEASDAKTGPGVYELAYAKSFGVPVETIKNPSYERGIGKVMELAFGYQGGIGAFHQMAKSHGLKVSDEKADEFKLAWRFAHPKTKQTWYAYQNAAISAVQNPNTIYSAGHPARCAKFKVVGSFLWLLLPSGRPLCLPYPKILEGEYGPQLTHMAVPSQSEKAKGKVIDDPQNSSNWARVSCHGGTLMGNITPAICRDILVNGMLALEQHGVPVVLHTHDECFSEVDERNAQSIKREMEKHLCALPDWARGFPLKADCTVMTRYGKGA